MSKAIFRAAGAVLAVAAVVYVSMFMPLPFVQAWWSVSDYRDPFHRKQRIADGLVLSRTLIGLSREEIELKLGVPPETSYFSNWDLVYPLGQERGFISIDSEWLVIRFDGQGTTSEARVVRD